MSQAGRSPLSEQDLGRRELHRQNKLLQNKLDQMVESVNRYRATQSRFEKFELQLLECQNLYDVIECLTKQLVGHFKLDAVTLTTSKIDLMVTATDDSGNASSGETSLQITD